MLRADLERPGGWVLSGALFPLTEGFHRPGEKESGVDRVLAPYRSPR
jgi:hypothetical protein